MEEEGTIEVTVEGGEIDRGDREIEEIEKTEIERR